MAMKCPVAVCQLKSAGTISNVVKDDLNDTITFDVDVDEATLASSKHLFEIMHLCTVTID